MIPLQMEKKLSRKPNIPTLPVGTQLQTFRERPDVDGWLEIRKQAFADQIHVARDWTSLDFQREFTSKKGWNDNHLAFLSCNDVAVGSIQLTTANADSECHGALNWLMVFPKFQGNGFGRILIEWSEFQAWDHGIRCLTLTTLPSWKSAIQCYRNCGYKTQLV